MFSAQGAGPQRRPMGMNHPKARQNKQVALKVFHSLAGLLDERGVASSLRDGGRPSLLRAQPPRDGLPAIAEARADLPKGQTLPAQRPHLVEQLLSGLPLLLPFDFACLGRRPVGHLAPPELLGASLGSLAYNPGRPRPLGQDTKADAGLLGCGAAGIALTVEAEGLGFLFVGVANASRGHAMLR